jgi:hypothetical protein
MRLSGAVRPLAIGFGLDALGVIWDLPDADEIWAVGAGRLPRLSGAHEALAARWLSSKGRPPTWYEALGHDAAQIAALALGPALREVVRDRERVRAIYRDVAARLASERWPDPWTSDGDRFDASRRLPREFRAERITPRTAGVAR